MLIGSAKPMNIVLANYSEWCLSQRLGSMEDAGSVLCVCIYISVCIKTRLWGFEPLCNCLGLSSL